MDPPLIEPSGLAVTTREALLALLAVIVITAAVWLWSRLQLLWTFKQIGINGPTPSFIYGNMTEVWESKTPWVTLDKWYHKYPGKVYGCFPMGIRPILVVGDLDIIKDILVKHFENFRNRPPLGPPRGEPGASSLTSLRGNRWKRVRNVISPTFTTKKIREMSKCMNAAASTFISVLDQRAAESTEFDIYAMFQALTLDVIAQAAFALSVESQTNPEDTLLKVCRALFKSFFSPTMKMLLLFPEFTGVLGWAGKFLRARSGAAEQEFYVITHMRKVYQERLKWPEIRGQDMMQLIIDASMNKPQPPQLPVQIVPPFPHLQSQQNGHLPTNRKGNGDEIASFQGKYLTENELVANCFVFLLAGYETTANALAFSTYLLAKHPEVQERLYADIMLAMGEQEELCFEDSSMKLPYLEAVIKESLRMFPPITGFVMRECKESCVIKNISIPEGMAILIPVWSLHHDPEYWPEPHLFNPDRFMGENAANIPQMAFMAFGDGPRNCIGMSFAMMEIRITIVRMLQKYQLLPGKNSEGPLELESPFVTMNPKNGVNVQLKRR
ncbi:Cytochrome P450 3A9 [Hypsibius exemplaris]|uniref:Cytochrome P450 3A9 n=1 Tax=Hypsibius exemplaris TaxID=2072580 RepID=A0A1W0XCM9_HYPEX|nr:Cytochrome P450 3A9 [Hypsibius exemplaris]